MVAIKKINRDTVDFFKPVIFEEIKQVRIQNQTALLNLTNSYYYIIPEKIDLHSDSTPALRIHKNKYSIQRLSTVSLSITTKTGGRFIII